MPDLHLDSHSDLLEQIPDPETIRKWLADSVRRSDLLRSLLRVALRKAGYRRTIDPEGKLANGNR